MSNRDNFSFSRMNLLIRISDPQLKFLYGISIVSGKENLSVQNPKFEEKNYFPFQLIRKNLQTNSSKLSDSVRLRGWWINCDHKLAQVTRTCMHACNIRDLNSWPVFSGGAILLHPHPSSVRLGRGWTYVYLHLLSVMK